MHTGIVFVVFEPNNSVIEVYTECIMFGISVHDIFPPDGYKNSNCGRSN